MDWEFKSESEYYIFCNSYHQIFRLIKNKGISLNQYKLQ